MEFPGPSGVSIVVVIMRCFGSIGLLYETFRSSAPAPGVFAHCCGSTVSAGPRSGFAGRSEPGSHCRDGFVATSWPSFGRKLTTRLISVCGLSTSSHGIHTLYEWPKSDSL